MNSSSNGDPKPDLLRLEPLLGGRSGACMCLTGSAQSQVKVWGLRAAATHAEVLSLCSLHPRASAPAWGASQAACWQLWEVCTSRTPQLCLPTCLPSSCLAAPLGLGEEQPTCVLRCSPPSSSTRGGSQRKPKHSVCFLSWSQEQFP